MGVEERRPAAATVVADDATIARVFREESGRCVATLTRVFGDLAMAEDAVQEAFVEATRTWPANGVPPNPGGWITTTARRRALDALRRDARRDARQHHAASLDAEDDPEPEFMRDDMLRLLFTCCHPALALASRVALTLRMVAGLRTPEIARALLSTDEAVTQRIVRAKRKIAVARIPYRVPEDHELPDRLPGVLAVVYLVFTEGHTATAGDALVRVDLCEEAIRLARVLDTLMPDEPEVRGLLALLLLTHARRATRVAADGTLVLLSDQDRSRWDAAMIAEGHRLVRSCLRRGRPGPYQVQAAIQAVHTDAPAADQVDWPQILALYDHLLALTPTPVVALNRAVAVAEVEGPAAGLAVVDALDVTGTHLVESVRADLLRRLGRTQEAADAYDAAIAAATNDVERRFLLTRQAELPR